MSPQRSVTLLYDATEDDAQPKGADQPVYQQVQRALSERGHELRTIAATPDLPRLVDALERDKSDLVFNLCEGLGGIDQRAINVASLLELMGKRFTGAGTLGLSLAHDKVLTKKIFAFHDLSYPKFSIMRSGHVEWSDELQFPLFVKPSDTDSSVGIDAGALVHDVKALMERISYIHTEIHAAALIEEFIEGREIYVGVLGSDKPEALPAVEMDLSKLPKGMPRIAGMEVKWDKGSAAYDATRSAVARDLPDELRNRIQETAVAAYVALGLRDYGRIDLRLAPKGEIYVIEANPNPWLAPEAELAIAAGAAGRDYPKLIGEIVDRALSRYA
jgi:D-alanine-D-alanine ligase